MPSIGKFLSDDHRRCDDYFLAAEGAVAAQAWNAAYQSFEDFRQSTERHWAMEEQVLFVHYESLAGAAGPTQVMRREHEQMRALCADLARALAQHAGAGFLGLSETLLMLMQQHNMKEERMLYPLCDRLLASESETVIARMQAVQVLATIEAA